MTTPYERLGSDPDITPDMVAKYIMKNAYHGRDHRLAEGWLIVLRAFDQGEDVRAALQEFVTKVFVVGNNNGVPLKAQQYKP